MKPVEEEVENEDTETLAQRAAKRAKASTGDKPPAGTPHTPVLAKSDFWKTEYDHEAAKKARAAKKAAKKTTKRKKKPSASELLMTREPAKQLKKSGQAKPNKKAKVTKPTAAPEVAESEQQISAPEASDK
nr:histone H1.3-like [Aegilops tauschii subsp. strangulata]